MTSLRELAAEIDQADQAEAANLWSQATIPPVVMRLVGEIGDDAVLAEAALRWVRDKKREVTAAMLHVLYTPEQLEAMSQQLQTDNQAGG